MVSRGIIRGRSTLPFPICAIWKTERICKHVYDKKHTLTIVETTTFYAAAAIAATSCALWKRCFVNLKTKSRLNPTQSDKIFRK